MVHLHPDITAAEQAVMPIPAAVAVHLMYASPEQHQQTVSWLPAAAAVAEEQVANPIPLMAVLVETEMATEPMVLLHQMVVADLEPSEQHLAEPVSVAQVS